LTKPVAVNTGLALPRSLWLFFSKKPTTSDTLHCWLVRLMGL